MSQENVEKSKRPPLAQTRPLKKVYAAAARVTRRWLARGDGDRLESRDPADDAAFSADLERELEAAERSE
jgi:hypothetical protein